MANVYMYQASYDLALAYFSKALLIQTRELGSDHLEVAATFANISCIYEIQGKNDHALNYASKSLAIKVKKLGAGMGGSIILFAPHCSRHGDTRSRCHVLF
jgi:tetratricopeptide (TPR) repeat protein